MSNESSMEMSGQGTLSPEEEERARLDRDVRRARLAEQPPAAAAPGQAQSAQPGAMAFAGGDQPEPQQSGGAGVGGRGLVSELLDSATDATGDTADATGGLFRGIGRGLNFVAERTTNALGAAGSQVADLTSATVSLAGDAGGSIGDAAGTLAGGLASAAGGVVDAAGGVASGAGSLAANVGGAAGAVGGAAGQALGAAGSAAGTVFDAASNIPVGDIAGAIGSAAGTIVDVAGNIPVSEIVDALGATAEVLGAVAEVAGAVLGAVADAAGDL